MSSSVFAKPKRDDRSKTSSKSFATASISASSRFFKSKSTHSSSFNHFILYEESNHCGDAQFLKKSRSVFQVRIPTANQSLLRFWWREDPTKNVDILQNTRHIYGSEDSPTFANCALQQTARNNQNKFPEAAKTVQQKFYMDDYLD